MKLILSPTKTMAPKTEAALFGLPLADPGFETDAGILARSLAALDLEELRALFKTSDTLTDKIQAMIQGFDRAAPVPALFAFQGEAFKTLSPKDFTRKDLAFANDHLRIFSGLYGVLAPLDRIRPYRLDFNTPLKIQGKSLKAYWKTRLIPYFESLTAPDQPLVNLASGEYTSALSSKTLKQRMITLQFREKSDGKLKNIPVRAKQARGYFAGHIIRKGLKDPNALKQAVIEGYTYAPDLSSDREWFFIR